MLREFHRIDRELDTHVASDFATAIAIVELLHWFCNDRKAVVIKPIDQRAERHKFLIFKNCCVVECPQQISTALEFFE